MIDAPFPGSQRKGTSSFLPTAIAFFEMIGIVGEGLHIFLNLYLNWYSSCMKMYLVIPEIVILVEEMI